MSGVWGAEVISRTHTLHWCWRCKYWGQFSATGGHTSQNPAWCHWKVTRWDGPDSPPLQHTVQTTMGKERQRWHWNEPEPATSKDTNVVYCMFSGWSYEWTQLKGEISLSSLTQWCHITKIEWWWRTREIQSLILCSNINQPQLWCLYEAPHVQSDCL